jgi:Spy/CpxP family protein refolding chaperone
MLIPVSNIKAQQRDTIRAKSGTDRVKLMKELNLTREQSRSLKSINHEYKSKADSIRNDNSPTREQKKQLIIERRQKIMEILTPEQRIKYKNLKQKS